jgi:hypothetical protein
MSPPSHEAGQEEQAQEGSGGKGTYEKLPKCFQVEKMKLEDGETFQ